MEKESLLKKTDMIVIRYVDSTQSNSLLYKFPDYSDFGFDYSQSAIWSPLVPRFHSLSCLNSNTKSPDFKKKITFGGHGGGGGGDCGVSVGCNGFGKVRFAGFKRKVCDFGSKFTVNVDKKKKIKSNVSDFNPSSPPSSKKVFCV